MPLDSLTAPWRRDIGNWIGGGEQAAQGGGWVEDVDPATSEVVARVARAGAEDVEAAVAAATAAAGPWGALPWTDRADLLDRVAAGIEARLEAFAAVESEDNGKPVSLARAVDISRAIANFRFFAGAIRHQETGFHDMGGAFNYTLRQPLGVVGLITPWNLPLYLLTWKVAPALAMGHTVVAKPSELTPRTAHLLAEVMAEVGVPDGVYNVVHGYGGEAGAAITAHPGVAAVSFTGGTATGRHVAAAVAPRFARLSLELGGKNPTLVFADADFEAALAGAHRAAFSNQGQICLCGSRLLVERPIYDRFVEALVARVSATRVGDPRSSEVDMGALVSLDHRDKVEGYLGLAVEEGGRILCGGTRPTLPAPFDRGAFLRPAIVGGLGQGCRAVQEEIFGPVLTVQAFDTEEEALALANGVRYGLAASVWTNDLGRAHRVAARLESGMVWVNTWMLRDLRVPFGGVKESGVGHEGGAWSLRFYSEEKNVCVKL